MLDCGACKLRDGTSWFGGITLTWRHTREQPTPAESTAVGGAAGGPFRAGDGVIAWLRDGAADLYPGYFALVMATGIVSNALFLQRWQSLSDVMFVLNLAAYPMLWLFTLARLIWFRARLWADMTDPRVVFGFFTIVAGSDVLGVGLSLRGFAEAGVALWFVALILWLTLIYLSFGVLTFLNTAHGANVVHGGWLIAIVGTESLVILGAIIAPELGAHEQSVLVLIHMLWGIGLGLYGIFITLFAYRIFFFDIAPDDITPLLWVVMGAAAITTNAGSVLIMTDTGIAFLHSMRPFIDGVTLSMWAWATWWIPLLVLFGVWKHVIRRAPIVYTPMLWSLVFPLGMYALASLRLSLAADFAPLQAISGAMVWIAVAAWALTGAGLLVSLFGGLRARLAV
ncbi:MAG: tellurite resistance/C4-dicarboxylate transporter family protein [Hyphomonadaceae bacterium]|nr:tellurite resistance/C4-dicarboxylate transporter family protein [Hyphomonadaceae bacterium]